MSNELMPIGKYKGKPIEAVLQDQNYIDWLTGQDWFREKYQNTYNVIINNFGEPTETPEHNEMQGWFLDDDFCWSLVKNKDQFNTMEKRFEYIGWDVFLTFKSDDLNWAKLHIELKPQIGDDYPAILRQVLKRMSRIKGNRYTRDKVMIIYKEYTGSGITETQMREMFNIENIITLRKDEI